MPEDKESGQALPTTVCINECVQNYRPADSVDDKLEVGDLVKMCVG